MKLKSKGFPCLKESESPATSTENHRKVRKPSNKDTGTSENVQFSKTADTKESYVVKEATLSKPATVTEPRKEHQPESSVEEECVEVVTAGEETDSEEDDDALQVRDSQLSETQQELPETTLNGLNAEDSDDEQGDVFFSNVI
jgi:hypothetical protein